MLPPAAITRRVFWWPGASSAWRRSELLSTVARTATRAASHSSSVAVPPGSVCCHTASASCIDRWGWPSARATIRGVTVPANLPVASNPACTMSVTSVSVSGPISTRSAWAKNGSERSENNIRIVDGSEPANTRPMSR